MVVLSSSNKNTTLRSNQIFENQSTTITKSTWCVAHDGRLTPSYLPMLGVRLVIELSYASSPLVPFSSRAQYTTTIPIISQRWNRINYHKEPTVFTDHNPVLTNVLRRRRPKRRSGPGIKALDPIELTKSHQLTLERLCKSKSHGFLRKSHTRIFLRRISSFSYNIVHKPRGPKCQRAQEPEEAETNYSRPLGRAVFQICRRKLLHVVLALISKRRRVADIEVLSVPWKSYLDAWVVNMNGFGSATGVFGCSAAGRELGQYLLTEQV